MKNDRQIHVNTKFTSIWVYGALALWFLFALVMGAQGRFVSGLQKPPLALGLTLALPMLFFVAAYARHGSFWAFCQTLDLRVITAVHLWRIVAIDFLVVCAQGRLPAGFALPAGIGDIITGVTAIPLALAISKGILAAGKRFVAWNIFGLLDLVLAVSLGILHSPSALGILAGSGPTTLLMSELPRSIIPTFLVPMFMLLHMLSLSRRSEVAGMSGVPSVAHGHG
jgi:hypothetical protein